MEFNSHFTVVCALKISKFEEYSTKICHSQVSFKWARVSQVTREGKYVHSNVPRQLVYGTMVYVRQTIVADASCALSRAVCIATRYSAVRRQFGSHNGGVETQVCYKYFFFEITMSFLLL